MLEHPARRNNAARDKPAAVAAAPERGTNLLPRRQEGGGYFRAGAAISGSGSAVVDFTRSMLMRLLTFFGPTAAISRL